MLVLDRHQIGWAILPIGVVMNWKELSAAWGWRIGGS